MNELIQFDESLFFLINGKGQALVLDWLMPFWRNKYTWIPLYVALAAFAGYKFRWKAIAWLLLLGLTIGAGDVISHRLIKKQVQRPRPCNTEALKAEIHLLVPCGSGYSFTSNHATNHFAMAVFFAGTLGVFFRRWRWLFYLWAFGVAYAQVYVGVHYPLDVGAGALLGLIIGGASAFLWKRYV
ncbi:MAG: phosphatase PAP2 family protein [Saprospirales bacterium]|nr:phosphatase PAP2 family protein [Saprospirales bacterium]MBK7336694.1 phosphatase PAP2 family protein [Saprospirales bacterium]